MVVGSDFLPPSLSLLLEDESRTRGHVRMGCLRCSCEVLLCTVFGGTFGGAPSTPCCNVRMVGWLTGLLDADWQNGWPADCHVNWSLIGLLCGKLTRM